MRVINLALLFFALFTCSFMKGEWIIMKRYFVLMNGKIFGFKFKTNSYKIAKWFADLKLWTYAKIHDSKADDIDPPWSKCIYINDRRGPK